jgi:hypothetical protein
MIGFRLKPRPLHPPLSARQHSLERFPIVWNHPIERKTLQINELEHVFIGNVVQLFRNML